MSWSPIWGGCGDTASCSRDDGDVAEDLVQATCLRALEHQTISARNKARSMAAVHPAFNLDQHEVRSRRIRMGQGFVEARIPRSCSMGARDIETRALLLIRSCAGSMPCRGAAHGRLLTYVEGLSYREVTDLLGIPTRNSHEPSRQRAGQTCQWKIIRPQQCGLGHEHAMSRLGKTRVLSSLASDRRRRLHTSREQRVVPAGIASS